MAKNNAAQSARSQEYSKQKAKGLYVILKDGNHAKKLSALGLIAAKQQLLEYVLTKGTPEKVTGDYLGGVAYRQGGSLYELKSNV